MSAYKRRNKEFQAKMVELANKRDADRAYYEQLIGRPLVETRSSYARDARRRQIVGWTAIIGGLVILAIWKML